MHLARHAELKPYVTADGSTIREWAGPGYSPARNLSLAEATAAHFHRESEELYLFTSGHGRLRVGEEEREVESGDCVVIPPGAVHQLHNSGDVDLVLVCACSPAYSHEDTYLVDAD